MPTLPTRLGARLACLVVSLVASTAAAQVDRFASEPSQGLAVPWTGLAGDADGAAVVQNPARGPSPLQLR